MNIFDNHKQGLLMGSYIVILNVNNDKSAL
jgi:hypothetical protein